MSDAKLLTPEEINAKIEEIRQRVEKATPGPWKLDENFECYIWGPASEMIADDGQDEDGTLTRMRGVGANLPLKANGEFIAHSREDIPWLLTQLQAEQQKNAPPENESRKKRETLDKFADYCIQRNVMLAENKTLKAELQTEQQKVKEADEAGFSVSADLEAERQKNAEGNELYRELALEFTNAADKALTLFHKANGLEAENKTLREALERAIRALVFADTPEARMVEFASLVVELRAALAKDGDK